jgi:hypothetical protein
VARGWEEAERNEEMGAEGEKGEASRATRRRYTQAPAPERSFNFPFFFFFLALRLNYRPVLRPSLGDRPVVLRSPGHPVTAPSRHVDMEGAIVLVPSCKHFRIRWDRSYDALLEQQ